MGRLRRRKERNGREGGGEMNAERPMGGEFYKTTSPNVDAQKGIRYLCQLT